MDKFLAFLVAMLWDMSGLATLAYHIFIGVFIPSVVHVHKMYIYLRQQLKLYGKYTFIGTYTNFIKANKLPTTLFEYVLTFNSMNG